MELNFDFSYNIIKTLMLILSWGVIFFFAYRIYKKQERMLKKWKILLVILGGLFSFSFNWPLSETLIKIPLLPLGVWILYMFMKGKPERWETYRRYAWLGFWANFIFLASTFLSIPLEHVFYPKDNLSTYIANVDDASILKIHPSAENNKLDNEVLWKEIAAMHQEPIEAYQWYDVGPFEEEGHFIKRNEQFPYLLQGVKSKWGSGLEPVIYVERDGKGLLVTTSAKQYYFRAEDSFMKGGE